MPSVFTGALGTRPGGGDVQEGLKLPGLGSTLNEVGGQIGSCDIGC